MDGLVDGLWGGLRRLEEEPSLACLALLVVLAPLALKAWKSTLRYHYYAYFPVSYPGDAKPEAQRLKRKGQWPERHSALEPGWVFLSAEDAHAYTNAHIGTQTLTGEPAGRQLWVRLGASHSSEANAVASAAAAAAGEGLVPPPPFDPSRNPNASDEVLRASQLASWRRAHPQTEAEAKETKKAEATPPASALDAARKGVAFYEQLQCADGHWAGDYGGPMFLLPGFVISHYASGAPLGDAETEGLVAYLRNHQQTDGGWGTHIECASTMFGTVLSYVSLRLLGVGAEDPACVEGRAFIQAQGGAVLCPSWAKFWLALLGLYEWEGINSIPPEMWMLPNWFPFHPGKLWCHCRMVYLPMCFLYGRRFTYGVNDGSGSDSRSSRKGEPKDPVILALRDELYCEPYAAISWNHWRQRCSPLDEYSPLHWAMALAQDGLAVYEWLGLPRWCPPVRWLREAGLRYAMEYIHAEDKQTNYICIGPVSKPLNMLCVWADGVDKARRKAASQGAQGEAMAADALRLSATLSPPFQRHLQRVGDYLWVAEDGMKVQGYNGSQGWDTSFAIQAIIHAGLSDEFPALCDKVWSYLEKVQIAVDEDDREYFYRHVSKGGWAFSNSAHGWPISDCTSEGLKAVLHLRHSGLGERGRGTHISDSRLFDAVNVLLSYQNHDGGWATYENNRGFRWYESLNPSEVFGDIMIDYSYVECTSASITALVAFRADFPAHRTSEIEASVRRGRRFLGSIQRRDGSWYGSWAVCFTYGTWFGIEGLVAAGEGPDSPRIKAACAFLLSKQNANGGWGENYLACVDKAYPPDSEPHTASVSGPDLGDSGGGVVQTAWAVLGLLASGRWRADSDVRRAIEGGVRLLRERQLPTGDWAQEGITGVFNRSCGITYTAYRNVFPIWALGVYGQSIEAEAAASGQ